MWGQPPSAVRPSEARRSLLCGTDHAFGWRGAFSAAIRSYQRNRGFSLRGCSVTNAVVVRVGMLRLRTENRFTLLGAPLSMTLSPSAFPRCHAERSREDEVLQRSRSIPMIKTKPCGRSYRIGEAEGEESDGVKRLPALSQKTSKGWAPGTHGRIEVGPIWPDVRPWGRRTP